MVRQGCWQSQECGAVFPLLRRAQHGGDHRVRPPRTHRRNVPCADGGIIAPSSLPNAIPAWRIVSALAFGNAAVFILNPDSRVCLEYCRHSHRGWIARQCPQSCHRLEIAALSFTGATASRAGSGAGGAVRDG